MAYPTNLDSFTSPTGSDYQNSPPHATQHSSANTAINELETKIGISSSDCSSATDGQVLTADGSGNSAWEAPDLAKSAIASQAQGDILYYDGSAWARLEAGTDGQFLKTQGAAANPTWAAMSVGASSESIKAGASAAVYFAAAWADIDATNLAFTLPSSGTYLIYCSVRMVHDGDAAIAGFIRLYNQTDGAAVTNSQRLALAPQNTNFGLFYVGVSLIWVVTFDSADEIRLQGLAEATNTVGIYDSATGYNTFGYVKLA